MANIGTTFAKLKGKRTLSVHQIINDVGSDNDLPYRNKKCAECGKPSHQGHNGRWWCDEHHPQRLCANPECKRNLGKFQSHRDEVCAMCKRGVSDG